ncbi:MAG TPA: hypothetical protein VGB82_15100 [Alphaproteobacteria bacterium]
MKRTNRHLIAGAVATTVLVAGCSDAVMVNRSEIAAGYTGDFYVQTQAQNGVNAVVLRNSPFPPDSVISAIQSRYQSNQYRFGPGPAPQNWNGYTVVIGFGGPTIGNQNLCQNPNLPLRLQSAGETSVIGDYCYGNILISEAQGWTGAVSGPQDPRFSKLMGAVVAELLADKRRYGKHGGGGSTPPR